MKKFLAVLLMTFSLSLPAFAACEYGTFDAVRAAADSQNVALTELTDAEMASLLNKKGPPPNAEEGKAIRVYVARVGDNSVLLIEQDGCFLNRLGPLPTPVLNDLIGSTQAEVR